MKGMILVFAFMMFSNLIIAQNQFTKTGHIWFYSEASMENIEAHNHQVTSIVNTKTGELVFKVLMKGYQFEKALMQEHFNQKYVESDKFPESVFKGKITNLSEVDFSKDGIYPVNVSGKLTIHGIEKEITANGEFKIADGKLNATALFKAAVADFNIKIPGAVKDNIAKEIDIHIEMNYEPLG